MRYWLAGAVLIALGGLVAARFLDTPAWIDALFVMGCGIGLAAALVVRMIFGRLLRPPLDSAVAAALLALLAALTRGFLVAYALLVQPAAGPPRIELTSIVLACSSVVWGLVALVWGALAVSDGFAAERRAAPVALGATASTLALYSLSPLWGLLGMRVNAWTLLGLVGLAGLAYGAGAIYRWALARLR